MEKPPVKKDESGKWVPYDNSVICDDNVGVYIAPIRAAYNQSFYHDNNVSAKESIESFICGFTRPITRIICTR